MDRRSFLTALLGGIAASAVGAVALSETAKAEALPAANAAALDETDAEFSQYHRLRRRYRRPLPPRHRHRRRHYR
ncbi:hypothetical protein [Bosea lathyri]|uniref:hypothetical protein n=1 Tax=Bosea lathyri TaxID=1036778 RepID=UPI0011B0712F|nr:hypothetical protein [Bosea lathyri]